MPAQIVTFLVCGKPMEKIVMTCGKVPDNGWIGAAFRWNVYFWILVFFV